MDSFTLFAANTLAALVLAAAFFIAGRARQSERYWNSWCIANIIIAAALLAFMFERHLPDLFLVTIPNCLLVLGMSLRFRAAREFAGRSVHPVAVWGPAVVFVATCAWPWIYGSYATVYTIVNILLAALAIASAAEFWRDRSDRLPSRYGMVAAYGIIALSFAARVAQGAIFGDDMPRHLPDDLMLMIHLSVAVLHLTASGAFALSLAYERDAVRLRQMAMHDSLTGLLNRTAFEAQVREYLSAAERRDFAVVLFDLDRFKHINDTYGHAAGDEALRACANVFTETLPPQSIVARWGGEEFAAFLPGTSTSDSLTAVERVRQNIRSTIIRTREQEIHVTTSAGVCHSSCGSGDFDELLMRADAALYSAKNSGRDCVERMVA
ncbi:GGDEF domain-containing protein [Chelativorans salis]|uniref:diguanylate cyclase n=1 Tax=Chelativorans salis TaxID=2978478 RepID=A0ABT2LS14_9HYPH|nr:GGDEF domain-containing protein [Chelativorans sp. EGI FJ00035]MCT7377161.1 GGDEF domain-containing protein [Chelativorans sp. EGI FJ00035]